MRDSDIFLGIMLDVSFTYKTYFKIITTEDYNEVSLNESLQIGSLGI
jgi:hypothetical protein